MADIKIEEDQDGDLSHFFLEKIRDFNHQHWPTQKKPFVVTIRDENNVVCGGGSAKSFGNWLMIENIWVNELMRGVDLAEELLNH